MRSWVTACVREGRHSARPWWCSDTINSPFSLNLASGHNLLSFFPPIPFIIFALLSSLPPSLSADPGSHSRLFSPPTHYGSCLAFLSRDDFSSYFPRRLASNRIVPTHARRRSQQFILVLFSESSKSRHGGIRTPGPTLWRRYIVIRT